MQIGQEIAGVPARLAQLDGAHQASAANVADAQRESAGKVGETALEPGGDVDEIVLKCPFPKLAQHGKSDGGCDVVVGERRGVAKRKFRIPGPLRDKTRTERENASAQRLGNQQDVGHHRVEVAGEGQPGPEESGLDFVGNECNAVFFTKLPGRLEVAPRWLEDAALPLYGLDDEPCCLTTVLAEKRREHGDVTVGHPRKTAGRLMMM